MLELGQCSLSDTISYSSRMKYNHCAQQPLLDMMGKHRALRKRKTGRGQGRWRAKNVNFLSERSVIPSGTSVFIHSVYQKGTQAATRIQNGQNSSEGVTKTMNRRILFYGTSWAIKCQTSVMEALLSYGLMGANNRSCNKNHQRKVEPSYQTK